MTQSNIHPMALVEPGAEIGPDCVIGPFCHVGPEVRLHARVHLKSHTIVTGQTEIGEDTIIYPFAVIGEIPQDLKFNGEDARLIIGARNRIREHVTINTGTAGGGRVTRVGDDGLFMTGCHIAHDAQIGDRVIIVNNTGIAGHCILEDDVIVGGLCGIHQFVRIGQGAMIGALTMVTHDVIPYGMVQGARGRLEGLNLVGLKRRGVAREDIHAVRAAFAQLCDGDGSFAERAQDLRDSFDSEYVQNIVSFIMGASDRSFLTPKAHGSHG